MQLISSFLYNALMEAARKWHIVYHRNHSPQCFITVAVAASPQSDPLFITSPVPKLHSLLIQLHHHHKYYFL